MREHAMRDSDDGESDEHVSDATYAVGFCRPPLHTRFKPGQSGNPSGRAKGAQNLRTLFEKILKEEISLREGDVTKKISKAEAILRGLVVGAMKGDSRSQMTLFRLAEQTGQFLETHTNDLPQVIFTTIIESHEGRPVPSAPLPAMPDDRPAPQGAHDARQR